MISLARMLAEIAENIPGQGPLDFFVHHNTLSHMENRHFLTAVKEASLLYDSRAFMPRSFYLEALKNQRIPYQQLIIEAKWYLEKHDIELPPELLVELICCEETQQKSDQITNTDINALVDQHSQEKNCFYHQHLKLKFGIDSDFPVLPVIYRFFNSYFDEGSAYWRMPDRRLGLWHCFCMLNRRNYLLDTAYKRRLARRIRQFEHDQPLKVIQSLLAILELDEAYHQAYLFQLCYRHKGWGGYIKSLLKHPHFRQSNDIIPDFNAFVAILLISEVSAIEPYLSALQRDIPATEKISVYRQSFIYQYLRVRQKNKSHEPALAKAFHCLCEIDCLMILHRAYENRFYNKVLSSYQSRLKSQSQIHHPHYQIICCMDDRLESLRRYLEHDPACETFSTAGHFGLNIAFKSYFDKHAQPLSPVHVKKHYYVDETIVHAPKWMLTFISLYGRFEWLANNGARTLFRAYIMPFLALIFSIIPFSLDILNPKILTRIKRKIRHIVDTKVITTLNYRREDDNDKSKKDSGLDLNTRVNCAFELLTNIGLTEKFSGLVLILGHGSSSMNNPHEASYNCGACGGGRGGPNARLMAAILNEKTVRASLLDKHGILIPDDTIFIGAYHNTCNNDLGYFDLDENKRKKLNRCETWRAEREVE
ncbi:MAG: putative inorganic carbon transporter subunit DabA [Francisellaceae bacterium]